MKFYLVIVNIFEALGARPEKTRLEIAASFLFLYDFGSAEIMACLCLNGFSELS